MALHAVRNILSGNPDVPLGHGNSAAAIVRGCAVYRTVADGDITTLLVRSAKILGFAAEAAAAADEDIKVYLGYPGMQFKLDFTGTYAVTCLGQYYDLTNTSGVPVVNFAASSYNHVKFIELVDNDSTAGVYTGWFELGETSNQNIIEVA